MCGMTFIDLEAIAMRIEHLGGSKCWKEKKKKRQAQCKGPVQKGDIVNTPGFPLKIQKFWHKSKSKL